ncbi:MAG TPA: metallophosphoesterase [Selenomonadales bacterium]|nr:metallophosphoesterase [Selenomonadales bacterium]
MRIFAIADTHLSGQPPRKPMSVFGDHWLNHWEKIKTDWRAQVAPDDVVLLAGDISWAMKLPEALIDLEEIAAQPGRKILVRGNHDYWWQTLSKMTAATGDRLTYLHNSFAAAGDFAVCGSRGWICPEDPAFSAEDQLIYARELGRVRNSLEAAVAAGFSRLILMLHYPPLYDHRPSGFTALMAEFAAEICVYGHLHNEAVKTAPQGNINGTECHLVSCDALGFKLKQIV